MFFVFFLSKVDSNLIQKLKLIYWNNVMVVSRAGLLNAIRRVTRSLSLPVRDLIHSEELKGPCRESHQLSRCGGHM